MWMRSMLARKPPARNSCRTLHTFILRQAQDERPQRQPSFGRLLAGKRKSPGKRLLAPCTIGLAGAPDELTIGLDIATACIVLNQPVREPLAETGTSGSV